MGYSSGILKDCIEVLRRVLPDGKFGKGSGKPIFERVKCVWANVTWTKGMKAMREGALDAYDTVMIRTRWDCDLTRDSFIGFDDKIYQIQSFHGDRMENTIQITAVEMV